VLVGPSPVGAQPTASPRSAYSSTASACLRLPPENQLKVTIGMVARKVAALSNPLV
jgi:hypothetical protein